MCNEIQERLVERVCDLCRQAGGKIMQFYRREVSVVLKEDASPLTAADRASHEFLVSALPALLPGVPVISEESGETNVPNGLLWLVDPLDGTKEFLKGTDEFTVNVALIEGGRPVLGVVHSPALDLTYYGAPDSGAWREKGPGGAESIRTRRADAASLSVVASKDHAGPLVQAMLGRLGGATLKSMGSSLKFCLVAEGSADLYLRDLPTMEWDTAAAQCIVEVAGGGVYDLFGAPLRYGKPSLRNGSIMTAGDRNFPWHDFVGNPPGS
jgi:3'(2'), 5'-bisphosphate nucleotidase